jgi:hypothetical protein
MGNKTCNTVCSKDTYVSFVRGLYATQYVTLIQKKFRKYLQYKRDLFEGKKTYFENYILTANYLLFQTDENYVKNRILYQILFFYQNFFQLESNRMNIIYNSNHYMIEDANNFIENFKILILKNLKEIFNIGTIAKSIKNFKVEYELDFEDKESEETDDLTSTLDKIKISNFSDLSVDGKKYQTKQDLPLIYRARCKTPTEKEIQNKRPIKTRTNTTIAHVEIRKKIKREENSFSDSFQSTTINRDNILIDRKDRPEILNILNEFKDMTLIGRTLIGNKFYRGQMDNKTLLKNGFGNEIMGDKGMRYEYIGYFKNGEFHGYGLYIKADGYVYQGEFRHGRKTGFGIEINENKVYRGLFSDGLYHGYGEIIVDNIITYVGCFNNGVKDGIGFNLLDDDSVYIGNYENDKMNGIGTFLWKGGHKFHGEWRNNKMEGRGKFTWKNGDYYLGNYVNDLKHGQGIYYFKSRDSLLRGEWINGLKEGKFALQSDGELYIIYYEKDRQKK